MKYTTPNEKLIHITKKTKNLHESPKRQEEMKKSLGVIDGGAVENTQINLGKM